MQFEEFREPIRPRNTDFNGTLSEFTRQRLGAELQARYEPIIDEPLDPRLADLMKQLEADREG